MSRADRPSLATWRAVILHREHPSVDALKRQLEMLHIRVTVVWPQIDEAGAWKRLRKIAMDWGMTIEETADAICRDDRRTKSGA